MKTKSKDILVKGEATTQQSCYITHLNKCYSIFDWKLKCSGLMRGEKTISDLVLTFGSTGKFNAGDTIGIFLIKDGWELRKDFRVTECVITFNSDMNGYTAFYIG